MNEIEKVEREERAGIYWLNFDPSENGVAYRKALEEAKAKHKP